MGQKREVLDSITLALASYFSFASLARKTHVKPKNHLNNTNKIRSSWHISFTQPAILKTVEKKQTAPAKPGLTRLERRFCLQTLSYEYFADTSFCKPLKPRTLQQDRGRGTPGKKNRQNLNVTQSIFTNRATNPGHPDSYHLYHRAARAICTKKEGPFKCF
jgi:hypothetical protein